MKVLIELKHVPDGDTVTKRSGTYCLTVKDTISVYNSENSRQVIKSDGCKFLVGNNAQINAVSEDRSYLAYNFRRLYFNYWGRFIVVLNSF